MGRLSGQRARQRVPVSTLRVCSPVLPRSQQKLKYKQQIINNNKKKNKQPRKEGKRERNQRRLVKKNFKLNKLWQREKDEEEKTERTLV